LIVWDAIVSSPKTAASCVRIGLELTTKASTLTATKPQIVVQARLCSATADRSKNVTVAAKVLALVEGIPTISGSGATFSVPVIRFSVPKAALSVLVLWFIILVARASIPLGGG
jgi:hypothetical protein